MSISFLNAQTTEVKGDGSKVVGWSRDRVSGDIHSVALAGILCRLVRCRIPTGWKARLSVTAWAEIIIDAKCETSVKGVFPPQAIVPMFLQQIIIATGEGRKPR